jgi:hypothetical protein
MRVRDYWKAITVDRSDFLDDFLGLLRESGARYCIVGGQAVNAYVDPVVSLDLDIVVAVAHRGQLVDAARRRFQVEEFQHINLSAPGSDLRVQIQTDPRYDSFVERATSREVLGITLPVAAVEDVLLGKVCAASDESRRASKRQKDLADIARRVEAFPDLGSRVPDDIQRRLL